MESLKEVKEQKPITSNKCDNCGCENVAWSADTKLWLRFAKPKDFLCPKCFVEKAKPKLKPNEGIGFKAEIFYK